jgi:hypothetical protein
MEFNRNQYFMVGLVILLLGIQFRMVDSYLLSKPVTKFLAEKTGKASPQTLNAVSRFENSPLSIFSLNKQQNKASILQKVVSPPTWLGLALISIGAILILHSFAMRAPGT